MFIHHSITHLEFKTGSRGISRNFEGVSKPKTDQKILKDEGINPIFLITNKK